MLTKTLAARRMLARLSGLGNFIALDAAAGSEFVDFKKDVLRLGTFVLDDGQVLDVTESFMRESAANTNRWIEEAGHTVWLPNGHTSDALENHGEWKPRFEVAADPEKGDLRVFGTVRVPRSDAAATKLGKTIREVSAGIRWGAQASNGSVFEGPVFEHVCITPNPVITGQGNFIPCAREAKSKEEAMKLSKEARARFVALAGKADAGAAVSDDVARQVLAAGMGLPLDSPWEKILAACLGDEAEESDKAAGSAPAAGAPNDSAPDAALMARLSKEVEEKTAPMRTELDSLRKKYAKETVEAAKASVSTPLDKDACVQAEKLLARGDTESETLGRQILKLAVEKTGAPIRGQTLRNPIAGAPPEGGDKKTKEDETRAAVQKRLAMSFPARYSAELDREGNVTKFARRGTTRSA